MRNVFFGFLIILAAVLVTHTSNNSPKLFNPSSGGNSGATTVSTRPVTCSTTAGTPTKAAADVVADGQFGCDGAGADNLWMTVTLQHKASNTDWVAVATGAFHGIGAATTTATSGASRTRAVQAACAAGAYRTVVEMSRISHGNTKSYKVMSREASPCG